MDKLFIKDIDVRNKKVLVRTDYNVPLDEHGNITDDTRIRATLPTINYLLDGGAKIIIASHFGRPKGGRTPEFSLRPVVKRLSRLLDKEVIFVEDCIGKKVKEIVDKMKPQDVVLLENLRFHVGEEKNDPEFAKALGSPYDVFIQDAFGNCHRNHASMVGITGCVPVSAAGFLVKKEIDYFEKAVNNPLRPVTAILGGAKVSDKIKIVRNLAERVDKIIIGGAMAFTFLKAQGHEIGKSLVEEDMIGEVNSILKKAVASGIKFYLPVDFVVAERFAADAETKIVTYQEIPANWYGLDIGPASTSLFLEAINNSKTILWNGPMGAFEMDAFSRGTYAMVEAIAKSHALTIVGGGDTDVALHKAGETHSVSYISTGGGAFLRLLEGTELPGIAALTDKKEYAKKAQMAVTAG
ncbi:MAG: phosphoglycerate kinase [Planctomycetes bacterium RIFCSPHIGHO2_02_FULL_50_42]|nr:MAG: phosphoglycerate kinase [Planctomycetes bacterium RIFCSPHIGHO2_02_FULL_50_42]OHC05097.1 MAG: phosphoglycerate kinase [Planctomycetes bacterium RIFCSPLOWO2_12_FULL_50_35]HCN18928.1 phosphoglycerate kinase [Planctomycetia bacterium]